MTDEQKDRYDYRDDCDDRWFVKDEKDLYDSAINFLAANPEYIREAWNDPMGHYSGKLFRPVTWKGGLDSIHLESSFDRNIICGCLTQIRGGRRNNNDVMSDADWVSYWPELTELIKMDERIPMDEDTIELDDLKVFAEYQRLFDRIRDGVITPSKAADRLRAVIS